jgi:hypothetical protein
VRIVLKTNNIIIEIAQVIIIVAERRGSRVPIWFGLESLMNMFNFKIMVIRINK